MVAVGKNFSCNNATGLRKKSDFYETPYSITRHFLKNENFDYSKSICEPACGNGAIVRVLREYWQDNAITHYDVETNFLLEHGSYDYIITNPPFSLANDFISKAKSAARIKFAMLLPLSYLHGKKRYDNIYTDKVYPLRKIYVLTRYPMLGEPLRSDGKYNTGMMVYAWYVFERSFQGPPSIHWIDNNADVLSSKDK